MPLTINVVAQDHGWLFADLLRHFALRSTPDRQVVTTTSPMPSAGAYIFLRPDEAQHSPAPGRTLIQLHDLYGDEPAGRYDAVRAAAALAITHPEQHAILVGMGIDTTPKLVVDRPVGYLDHFTRRESGLDRRRFTLGWFGRPSRWQGQDIKRLDILVEAARLASEAVPLHFVLVGQGLESIGAELRDYGDVSIYPRQQIALTDYPGLYRQLDALAVTSATEAGPLVFFEASATGVPTISTRVGWPRLLIQHGETGYLADTPNDMALAIADIYAMRSTWFKRGKAIRAMVEGYTLESWLDANLAAAEAIAHA